jgi:hypothetical protein
MHDDRRRAFGDERERVGQPVEQVTGPQTGGLSF